MPARRATPKGYARARELRHNQTEAEAKLLAYLRRNQLKGIRFRRQHAIGNYIVDFCIVKAKLIIEPDGSQHLDQVAYDAERTAFFEAQGYRILRFWDQEVFQNMERSCGLSRWH